MGTRGSLGWTFDGRKYTETYNHFDSYLEGLGQGVIKALKGLDIDKLKENIQKLTLVADGESKPTAEEKAMYAHLSEDPNQQGENMSWYWLLRTMQGADMLPEIEKGELHHVITNNGFMKDSLFCEFAYMLNFKNNTLEFYDGFQKTDKLDKHGDTVYGKCKKVGKIKFETIKEKTVEELMKIATAFYEKVEEKEEDLVAKIEEPVKKFEVDILCKKIDGRIFYDKESLLKTILAYNNFVGNKFALLDLHDLLNDGKYTKI